MHPYCHQQSLRLLPLIRAQYLRLEGFLIKKKLKIGHTLAFLKQLTSQTIKFTNPAVLVLLRNYLQYTKCHL